MGTDKESRKLMRIKPKGWLGGVCAGFSYWIGWPTWIIRALWTVVFFAGGTGGLIYIILWIFMPATYDVPADYDERTTRV
ncbi:PspC domain-containing protein [Candidatus Poribacteria bacterium]|nr:PspC domain-containing protein [Candidatus Poribacteria bacterium]